MGEVGIERPSGVSAGASRACRGKAQVSDYIDMDWSRLMRRGKQRGRLTRRGDGAPYRQSLTLGTAMAIVAVVACQAELEGA